MPKKKRFQTADVSPVISYGPANERREGALVFALCILAAVRVFVFSAAFPFFGNVDEQAHFDLCLKYANGTIPGGLEDYSREAAELIVLYGSPEYLHSFRTIPGGAMPPPIWSLPPHIKSMAMKVQLSTWLGHANHESTQFPVYYTLAAGWWLLGKALGVKGGHLLYWLRFVNVLVYGLLTWFSYVFTRRFYGQSRFLRLGVPCLVAFFPQDVFYTINNDVLSPLLFVIALFYLLDVVLMDDAHCWRHLLTGLAVAAAFLVKISNFAILVGLGIVCIWRISRMAREGRLRSNLPKIFLLGLAALMPIGSWFTRNYFVVGDLTASGPKIQKLGWVLKPVGEIWHHPIFTLSGFCYFFSDLMKTFWRGELVWHTERLASPFADNVYVITTALFLLASIIVLAARARGDAEEDKVGLLNLAMLGLSVAMLIGVSIAYDFGNCWYPSRESPYVTSGRLISGMLVPFIILYLIGMDRILTMLRISKLRWVVLFGIIGVAMVSEIVLTIPVFHSSFNWYHLQ